MEPFATSTDQPVDDVNLSCRSFVIPETGKVRTLFPSHMSPEPEYRPSGATGNTSNAAGSAAPDSAYEGRLAPGETLVVGATREGTVATLCFGFDVVGAEPTVLMDTRVASFEAKLHETGDLPILKAKREMGAARAYFSANRDWSRYEFYDCDGGSYSFKTAKEEATFVSPDAVRTFQRKFEDVPAKVLGTMFEAFVDDGLVLVEMTEGDESKTIAKLVHLAACLWARYGFTVKWARTNISPSHYEFISEFHYAGVKVPREVIEQQAGTSVTAMTIRPASAARAAASVGGPSEQHLEPFPDEFAANDWTIIRDTVRAMFWDRSPVGVTGDEPLEFLDQGDNAEGDLLEGVVSFL